MSDPLPPVPMVDLCALPPSLRDEMKAAVLEVLDSQRFIKGPRCGAFEAQIAHYLGTGHAIGCASGTDALLLALRAIGVGPGDEVITSPFTFIATAEAIVRAGATPVFADIDPASFNLDPQAVAAAVTGRTRAVLPVHLYGQSADMPALQAICATHGLRLIEDAAQAIGATCGPARLGSLGDLGCFSFYPSKNLGAAGDGGLVVTSDPELAARVRLLAEHGHVGGYRHETVGLNSRLDELQAAILAVKLPYLDGFNEARRQIAARYDAALGGLNLTLPIESPRGRHVYHQYTLRSPRRDALRRALTARGVGSVVYYPIPAHRQPSMAAYAGPSLPYAEAAAAEVLSLPIFPGMREDQQDRVCQALIDAQT